MLTALATIREEKAEMSDFHVFYCRNSTGDGIASHAPSLMEIERITTLVGDVLEENGDFLGLVDDDDRVLQFMYLARADGDQQPIRMELPAIQKGENVVRHISSAELLDLLQSLPAKLSADVTKRVRALAEGS